MSLIGLSPTITATRTIVAPMELASSTNFTANTSVNKRVATSTRPANASGQGTFIVSPSLNYLKVQTLGSVSGGAVTAYIIGWSFSTSVSQWIPTLLTKLTVTNAASGTYSSTLYPGLTYVKTLGDAKIYNGEEASCPGGFVVVDVTGCELVEIQLSASSGTCNAAIGYI